MDPPSNNPCRSLLVLVNALWLADRGLGCVGSDPTSDEAENASEKIVSNETR